MSTNEVNNILEEGKVIPVSKQGYQMLLERRADLKKKLDEAGQQAGEAAGPNCDWHDNPAYELAIEEMRMLSYQLNEVSHQVANAQIIEENVESDTVTLGVYVTIEIEGDTETYFIGGEADSNPSKGVISHKSPLAQAIMGCKAGAKRTYRAPAGVMPVKVIKVGKDKNDTA